MADSSKNSSNTEKSEPRRRWFHRSTIALTFCFAIPFLLVAVPGKFLIVEQEFINTPRGDKHTVAIHGWPVVHCIANHESNDSGIDEVLNNRKVVDSILFGDGGVLAAEGVNSVIWANEHRIDSSFVPLDFEFHGPFCYSSYHHPSFWSDLSHYRYFGSDIWMRWSVPGILINAICFLMYLVAVATSFEFLRRRKNYFFQITILEFLIGVTIFGAVAGWLDHHYRRSNSIRKSIDAVRKVASLPSHFRFKKGLPVWLERLGDGRIDKLSRSQWSDVSGTVMPETRVPFGCANFQTRIYDIEDPRPVIEFFEQVSTVSAIGLTSSKTENLYEVIESLNPNHLVEIEIYHKQDFDVSRLASINSLRQIDLHSIDLKLNDLKEPGFENVEWLRFTGNDPNRRISSLIHAMPKLETLYIKKDVLDSIKELPNQLRTLGVTFESEFELVDYHEKFSNLTRLNLYPIKAIQSKEFEFLRDVGMDLGKLPNLKRLVVSGILIDETTVENFNKMPNLEYVVLYDYQSNIAPDRLKKLVPEITFVQ